MIAYIHGLALVTAYIHGLALVTAYIHGLPLVTAYIHGLPLVTAYIHGRVRAATCCGAILLAGQWRAALTRVTAGRCAGAM